MGILEPATSGAGGMESMRDLSSALWSLRTSQEAARLLRTSLSLLRCFLLCDIWYLIGGITLISMALSNQVNDQENRMVFAGGLLTLFGSLSAMCNSLASHGLRTWRRAFLLPWLLFFLLVLAFLFLHLAQVFYQYHLRLKWEHLFLFLATYCLFSCWRHIHKQYLVMAFPRPEHGGGFVWRAGVGYQYQGGKGGSEQQKGKDRRSIEREGRFTQGLGWEHFYTSNGPSS